MQRRARLYRRHGRRRRRGRHGWRRRGWAASRLYRSRSSGRDRAAGSTSVSALPATAPGSKRAPTAASRGSLGTPSISTSSSSGSIRTGSHAASGFGTRIPSPSTRTRIRFEHPRSRVAGSDAVYAFSGEIVGAFASGIARRDLGDSNCRVGWAASPRSQCDDAAINDCLDLLDCCTSILVNPVFFQTCNSVVQQCDQTQCQEVLAGYPQCAPAEP